MSRLINIAEKFGRTVDQIALAISPSWGGRRIATRQALSVYGIRASAFEAAETDRIRGNRYKDVRISTNSSLEEDLETTRVRSREIYRNDCVGGAVDVCVDQIVGTGFSLQSLVPEIPGVITEDQAREIQKAAEKGFRRWSRKADRSGQFSFWMLSRLVLRQLKVDGESLTILSDIGRADKNIPLVLEVIDVDRLETPPGRINDPLCRLGVEHDKSGQIVAYHIRKTSPYDQKDISVEYDRVPADRVLHVFEPWFAEQTRGLPWMVRALGEIKDAKDLREAAIIRQQVEACYAAFVKTGSGGSPYGAAQGARAAVDNGVPLQDMRPGTIQYLGADQEVSFGNPTPSSSFGQALEQTYRRIAGAMNFAYEFLVKNWQGTSFAGGRLILHGAKISTRVGQKLIAEQWIDPIWRRAFREMVIVGDIPIDARVYAAYVEDFEEHAATPPAWQYSVNPKDEVDTTVTLVRENLMTKTEACAELHRDFDQVATTRQREKKTEAERGITPPDEVAAPQSAPVPADQSQPEEVTA